jgi:hypothetical protein
VDLTVDLELITPLLPAHSLTIPNLDKRFAYILNPQYYLPNGLQSLHITDVEETRLSQVCNVPHFPNKRPRWTSWVAWLGYTAFRLRSLRERDGVLKVTSHS